MVARGDLAVEIGDAEVPLVQKEIIRRARHLNKPVIIATQMMESMVNNSCQLALKCLMLPMLS